MKKKDENKDKKAENKADVKKVSSFKKKKKIKNAKPKGISI